MKNKDIICKTCGRIINEDEELAYTVNHGLEDEYVQCELCHDADWEESKIVICEACGEWFTPDKLHDEKLSETHSFTPCPICGKDIVDGCSREDVLEELPEEMHLERFSVIIHWANGGSRGYVIAAKDANEMMKKLMERVDLKLLQSISYSPILIDEDVMI